MNMVYENDEHVRHERTTKDATEDACIRENEQRFFQSSNTPFIEQPSASLKRNTVTTEKFHSKDWDKGMAVVLPDGQSSVLPSLT